MKTILRYIWFEILMKPLVLIVLGLNIRNRSKLYQHKQMIFVANHNSHLDTMVLMTLFPHKKRMNIRPVAAMDYFLRNRFLRWFAENIIQIVPVSRENKSARTDPLASCCQALNQGSSLILYPEGTRGHPEKLENFKTGIAHLVKRYPDVPVVPIFCHGLGKALPKGELLLVPFYCDVFVGDSIFWQGNRNDFMDSLNSNMRQLAEQGQFEAWQ
jgi:1-acyl-sn-glycerol-3-phosphate acyltransferase